MRHRLGLLTALVTAKPRSRTFRPAGPDGNLWFTDGPFNHIGQITLHGIITEFSVPTSGSGPAGITAGPDSNIWFVEYSGNKIGKFITNGSEPRTGRTIRPEHSVENLFSESSLLAPVEAVAEINASATAVPPAEIVSLGDRNGLLLASDTDAASIRIGGSVPATQLAASVPVLARAHTAGAAQPLLDQLSAGTAIDWLSTALLGNLALLG